MPLNLRGIKKRFFVLKFVGFFFLLGGGVKIKVMEKSETAHILKKKMVALIDKQLQNIISDGQIVMDGLGKETQSAQNCPFFGREPTYCI